MGIDNKIAAIISDQMVDVLTEKEKIDLEEWKKNDLDNALFLKKLASPTSSVEVDKKGEEVRRDILTDVQQRIVADKRIYVWTKISAIAASIALLFVLSNYFFYQSGKAAVGSQMLEVSSPQGLLSTITLSDGTKVTLNSGTTLSYPSLFTSNTREVHLSGQAFFDVSRDDKHPFIVHTEDLDVRVLGTKFDLKSYEDDAYIQVTLNEGSVGVHILGEKETAYLTPNEQIRFDKQDKTLKKEEVNASYYSAWTAGNLYFRGTPFSEVVLQLERRFNVNIEIISENLKDINYYGEYIRGENLEQVLKIIALDQRIGYTIKGDKICIYEK